MSQLNQTFIALLNEAQFTKELLAAGATDIRRANYATKGVYFQSFTNLSTGLERIGKLCLILNHYIETDGRFPDYNQLKNEIGHDLTLLQQKSAGVIARRNLQIEFPSTDIHQVIVTLLSKFAKGDRYSNLNLLTGSHQKSDPISSWFTQVDRPLFESCVTARKRQRIAENARVIAGLTSSFTSVLYTSETGSEITNVEEASYSSGIYQAVAPYRQLYILQIIRFWSELLRALQHIAQELDKRDIPYFSEVFAVFCNTDAYMRTRKIWNIA